MPRKRYSNDRLEAGLVSAIDFQREFEADIKRMDALVDAEDFTTNKRKQRELDALLIGIDRKMLAEEIREAIRFEDKRRANSLMLVYHEKYLKGKIAKEAGIKESTENIIKIYLPEQNDDESGKELAAPSGTPDEVSPED